MRGFAPSRFPTGEVPNGIDLAPAAAQTFNKGVILTRVGDTVQEHPLGATVNGVFGIALCGATDGEGDALNGLVSVAIADRVTEFWAQIINVATIVTPVQATHLGQRYGVLAVGGYHYIDVNDTTDDLVEITKVMPEHNAVLCKFLESTLQQP